jgi:hypothetical protein
MKLILALALCLGAVNGARGDDFVFETQAARLSIRQDGIATSLIEKAGNKERLRPGGVAFAAVKKGGRIFPASAVSRSGDMLHVTFGTSGVDADYRISAGPDYIVVELTASHGDGIEEIRLMQLNTALSTTGSVLGVQSDNDFAVCLLGLSDRVDTKISGAVMMASVYPEFAMQGERVAIVAEPTPRFLATVRKVEQDFHLPSPMLDGAWAKISPAVRTSYLFTDLTEANVDETIRYAKLAGFRYILVYVSAWSGSLGSYPINTKNFPHGEAGLKAVIDKCHTAGLKVGMHMLTSFVGKDDPLVRPKPTPWLLKDVEADLAADVSEAVTELGAASALSGFPAQGFSYGPANDILIDDEIIHYGRANGSTFVQCVRGFAGTKPAPHKAGAKIYHLVEYAGSYIADLKTPLKDLISDRVAGVISRCGFDMIYFDGGEINDANKPGWYWSGQQQVQIWQKSMRELLVEGSGFSNWMWHIYSRGTSDDYSAVAVKEYLDGHKIADSWKRYHDNFLPAELGWTGFLAYAPDHPATTPDDVEYYATRMLALDSAVSLETTLDALKANGRTEEMLKLFGEYEQLRLSGAVPQAVRNQLAKGEWHMTRPGEFHPIRYDAQRTTLPGDITVKNQFSAQPLKFRLQAEPALAAAGDPANLSLLKSDQPIQIQPPDAKAILPGSLIRHFDFAKPLDMTKHRELAVQLEVEGASPGAGEPPVLNIQVEGGGKTYRDYYIDLDFNGPKTIILTEPGTKRMLAEFRPASVNYPFKAAMMTFNYGNIVALNLRWMRYPRGRAIQCKVSLVEALEERNTPLKNVEISAGSSNIIIPGEMNTGDYAEYWADGTIRVFNQNGVTLSTSHVTSGPQLKAGDNTLTVKAAGSGNVMLTAVTLGQ